MRTSCPNKRQKLNATAHAYGCPRPIPNKGYATSVRNDSTRCRKAVHFHSANATFPGFSAAELTTIIQSIFTKSRGTYGTRRIRYSLLRQNLSAGRRRIGRLMRDADLVCRTQRKFKATTNSNHGLPVADNLLDRQEYDHADIFPDLDAIKKQFHHLVRTVPSEGLIINPACEKNISGSLS
ncbi:MAG: IS3 family transposase [Methyloglobulus sp.]|nr:IS3 family transposase [Methyloglobulus sp.]